MPDSNLFNQESLEAAESISKTAPALRYRIRHWINSLGSHGATADEVLVHFDLDHQTGSARVTELKQSGKIVPSGRRRRTRTGRWAAVMIDRSIAINESPEDKHLTDNNFTAISSWALVVRSEIAILEEAARFKEPERVRSEWALVLKSWRKLRAYIREVIS